jgi:hypothetical protein
LWRQRFARFLATYRSLHGASARARYLTVTGRKFVQLVLQQIAHRVGGSPLGTPANISLASGIERASTLAYAYANRLKLSPGHYPPRINLVIPMLSPAIIFGGYISFFNFASRLIARGYPLRFIVTENMSHSREQLLNVLDGFPAARLSIQNADVVRALPHVSYTPIPVSRQDVFIAYSAFSALLCHRACEELGTRRFIFYLQEEEGHFHSHNAYRATVEYVYTLPHIAIFNSPMLENYFRMMNLGVFSTHRAPGRYMTFRHALSTTRHPVLGDIAHRSPKKLLFFARPEQHAERNLFEIGLIALRSCCDAGLFRSGEWEFHAIGAMTDGFSLNLGEDRTLKFLARRPTAEYTKLLYQYDLGVSLMYAPHPSVPNFEMAAAGMPTVTTTFVNRSKAEMESICANFIAVQPHIEGVKSGIGEAVGRVYDYETRVENAKFEWPRSWDESFTGAWLDEFDRLVAEMSPGIRAVGEAESVASSAGESQSG